MTNHKLDLTGDYETTVYDAARRLLAAGADLVVAVKNTATVDTVETWRDGKLSMSGKIGELAKWQVEFRASGPCLTRYRAVVRAPLTGKTASGGSHWASGLLAAGCPHEKAHQRPAGP
jgi:hypothetical protein